MATEHSDVDVYVVVENEPSTWTTRRTQAIDEFVVAVNDVAKPAPFGTDGWWGRWSFTHAQVLLDRLDGGIARMVREQAAPTPDESAVVVEARLDGYLNFAYRSLKSATAEHSRHGFDAAESIPWALDVIFAFEGRVRPYHEYLSWELEHHPLPEPEWRSDVLLSLLEGVLAGDPSAQRELFRVVEREARAYDGRGGSDFAARTIEAWRRAGADAPGHGLNRASEEKQTFAREHRKFVEPWQYS